MKKVKHKLFFIGFILIIGALSLSACGLKAPSIFGDLHFSEDKKTVLFLVEGNPNTVPAMNVDQGDTVTLPDAEVEGNTFLGWSENGPNDSFPLPAGTLYTVNATVVMFAVLEKNNMMTVTFSVSGDTGFIKSKYCLSGSKIALPVPEVASHTFKGWSETGPEDPNPLPISSYYTVHKSLTLYAVLEKNPGPYETVTVKFSVDGSVRSDWTRVTEAGSAIELPNASGTKTGYNFVGWTETENGTGTLRVFGSKFIANKNTVLYAKYALKLVVVFDINGKRDIIMPAFAESGDSIVLPGLTLEDSVIAGWSETSPDDLNPMQVGDYYRVMNNTVLYAVLKSKIVVSYVAQHNGTDYNVNDINFPKTYVPVGGKVTLPNWNINIPGYVFIGWKTHPSNTDSYDAGAIVTVDRDTVFYASIAEAITIYFDIWHNGINYNEYYGNIAPMTVGKGQKITLPKFSQQIPYYTFSGWYDYYTGNTYNTTDKYSFQDTTFLTAVITPQPVLTFDVRLGATDYNIGGVNVPEMRADAGSSITLPGLKINPTGYMLIGWSETSAFDPSPMKPKSSYTLRTDKTLYAVLAPAVTVDFDVNGRKDMVSPITAAIGQEITLPDGSHLTYGSRGFGGWSLQPSSAQQIKVSSPYKVTAAATFYPIWVEQATVYFNILSSSYYSYSRTVPINSYITLPAPDYPSNALGWSYTSAYDYENYMAPGTQIQITGFTELYLVVPVPVTVTFSVNNNHSIVPAVTCNIYSNIVLPDVAVKDYDLQGWCLNQNLTGMLYAPGSTYNVSGYTTFYAKLIKSQISTQFSVNGSVVASLTKIVVINSQIILPDPDIPGYKLLGWSVNASGSGTLLLPLSKYTADAHRTLYAVLESATENYTFTPNGTGYYVTSFSGTATKLTIPSTYNGGKVTGIASAAFYDSRFNSVVSVTLPESIKTISNHAFTYAESLETINLENVEYIGDYAFYYVPKLKIASLNTINALTYIGSSAFAYACTEAADRSSPFIITPKIATMSRDVFSGWTSNMSINVTAVNKTLESYDTNWLRYSSATIIDDNGRDFVFDLEYNAANGECAVIGYHGTSQTVVIPEQFYFKGKFYKVTAIAENALADNSVQITKVIMGAGITTIHAGAFKDNWTLSTIVFNRNNITIAADAFHGTIWYYKQNG